jgi:8-amino-3,8-dideoxy-alpha-D-manno-octulosonate transaminase
MLPQTDDLLKRAINIGIGVSDVGLGSNYGININSSEEEIELIGHQIVDLIRSSVR